MGLVGQGGSQYSSQALKARRAAALAVAEGNTRLWEEFREAMETFDWPQGSSNKPSDDLGREIKVWP